MARKTFRSLIVSALAATFLFAAGATAQAQARACATHDDITTRLGKSFQEKQKAFGLVGSKAIVELFVSGKGSWTIIVTGTDGNTCILAAGEGWETVPQLAGPEV